jgi:tRNA wybutosine-synthesizing protein 3
MNKDNFQQRKQDILSKIDKSSKKSWDKKIEGLCEKINSLENYYTTSSCAGRIVLIIDKEMKSPGLFRFVSHDEINFEELKKELEELNENLKFKSEPCILHVACNSLENAQKFLDKAKLSGWKRSGIISSEKRFIVEMNGTEKLEFPIIENKRILVDDEFLKIVVEKSNENLKKSWEKIEKLEELID